MMGSGMKRTFNVFYVYFILLCGLFIFKVQECAMSNVIFQCSMFNVPCSKFKIKCSTSNDQCTMFNVYQIFKDVLMFNVYQIFKDVSMEALFYFILTV